MFGRNDDIYHTTDKNRKIHLWLRFCDISFYETINKIMKQSQLNLLYTFLYNEVKMHFCFYRSVPISNGNSPAVNYGSAILKREELFQCLSTSFQHLKACGILYNGFAESFAVTLERLKKNTCGQYG